MNEPHYVLDINVWAKTVQKVVFAIRSAGSVQFYQMAQVIIGILLLANFFSLYKCIYSKDPPSRKQLDIGRDLCLQRVCRGVTQSRGLGREEDQFDIRRACVSRS